MPASYAHYRFGRLALPKLPEEKRRCVQRFRQLFDAGLHGPDLFFYYNPAFHTKIGALGSHYHHLTGKEFFEGCVSHLREHYSEGGEAYLLGVLCHFTLDSFCHPLVNATAAEGKIGHIELETEFDRSLMAMDGIESPQTTNTGSHMRLTWGECVTVSGFYPETSAYTIRQSMFNMALVHRAIALKNRKLVENGARLFGAAQMVMYSRPNHKCAGLIPQLHGLYDEALEHFPAMAEALLACIRGDGSLGGQFDLIFG